MRIVVFFILLIVISLALYVSMMNFKKKDYYHVPDEVINYNRRKRLMDIQTQISTLIDLQATNSITKNIREYDFLEYLKVVDFSRRILQKIFMSTCF